MTRAGLVRIVYDHADELRTSWLWPGADGQPHVTWFDAQHGLSFVWDGRSRWITVAPDGYGEQPWWLIPVEPTGGRVALTAFAAVCADWVTLYERARADGTAQCSGGPAASSGTA